LRRCRLVSVRAAARQDAGDDDRVLFRVQQDQGSPAPYSQPPLGSVCELAQRAWAVWVGRQRSERVGHALAHGRVESPQVPCS
jgi:hypothetical protein